jgi:hypothetical protein
VPDAGDRRRACRGPQSGIASLALLAARPYSDPARLAAKLRLGVLEPNQPLGSEKYSR